MSFSKARQLIHLAQMAAAQRQGVSLQDICIRFECSHRTAQRMTDALEDSFQDVEILEDFENRKRWWLPASKLHPLNLKDETGLEAMDLAIREAKASGRHAHAQALNSLRDRFLASLQTSAALRAEADAEAVLFSLGAVARPGPNVPTPPGLFETLSDALRGLFQILMRYESSPTVERRIEPLGVLMGTRSYLVAQQRDRDLEIRHFRLDRILSATLTNIGFEAPAGFDLQAHAERSFAAYHDPNQYCETIWRFAPHAAKAASGFRFHPSQQLEPQEDGSLIVRFQASGWLEMCWHLYQWGDAVDVLAPQGLRDLIQHHRRSDFDILP